MSILGLVGRSATQPLIANLGNVAPGPAKTIFTRAIQNLQKSQWAAGIVFVAGLAGLCGQPPLPGRLHARPIFDLDVEEGRPIWKTLPVRLGVTLVLVLALAASTAAVILTGDRAKQVGNLVGAGRSAVSVWDIAKWPVLLIPVSLMYSLLGIAQCQAVRPQHRRPPGS